jgi:hypothetical protein
MLLAAAAVKLRMAGDSFEDLKKGKNNVTTGNDIKETDQRK